MNENEAVLEPQTDEDILCEDITQFLVQRRMLSELSEYFGRDARRYDNGFEIY
mgnify:CR=1 FL=1